MKIVFNRINIKNEILEYIKGNKHSEKFRESLKNDFLTTNDIEDAEKITNFLMELIDFLKENCKLDK